MHIIFTVRCCDVMQSCWTCHAWATTHADNDMHQFSGVQISNKVSSDLPKREKSPYSELKDRCFTSLQNVHVVHDFIQNLYTSTCTIRCLKRNFSRLYKLSKRCFESMSFKRVIRQHLSLTSLYIEQDLQNDLGPVVQRVDR